MSAAEASAAKERIPSRSKGPSADFSLAARAELAENSHQGFKTKNSALHQGWSEVNFKTVTGIEVSLRRNGLRSRCQSLNRYAYVLNNPTTLIDPLGTSPSVGGSFCPPESGQCQWIPTPGKYDPYTVNGPGGSVISTGSLIGTTSTDMAQGEANYIANNCLECVTVIYGNSSQEYSRQFENLAAYYDWVTDPDGGLPLLQSYKAYQAYLLDCQYATTPCGVNDKVTVTTTGVTTNAQLPGDPANVASLAQNGYRDPTNAFHKGHNSWFIGFWGLFGFNEGHVVADPGGIISHYDDFGPLNPLHYIIQVPLGVFNTGQVPYTCSKVGGCSP